MVSEAPLEPSDGGLVPQGEGKVVPNDAYWQATYALYKCNAELARGDDPAAKAGLTETQRGLKAILIRGGIPERWQDEFESLRRELIPDFQPPTTAPAA